MQNSYAERQLLLLEDLAQLVKRRAADEVGVDAKYANRQKELLEEYQQRRDVLTQSIESDIKKLRAEFQRVREDTIFNYESTAYALVQEEEQFNAKTTDANERALERAKRDYQVARRIALDHFAENKDKPMREAERVRGRCETRRKELQDVYQQGQKILRRRGIPLPEELPEYEVPADGEPLDHFKTALTAAQITVREMLQQPAAKFIEDGWPFLIFLFLSIGVAAVCCVFWSVIGGAIVGPIVGLVTALVVRMIVRPRGQQQTLALLPDLLEAMALGETVLDHAERIAQETAQQKYEEMVEEREEAISQAHATWSRQRVDIASEFQSRMQKAKQEYKGRRTELRETYQQDLQGIDEHYPPRITAREDQFATDSQLLAEERQQHLDAAQGEWAETWQRLIGDWTQGFAVFTNAIDEMVAESDRLCPVWEEVDWEHREPPTGDVPSLRFGNLGFHLDTLDKGVPEDDRLRIDRTEFQLPAVLSYPECPSLVYEAEEEGRDAAVRSIQNVMLRLLASLPPGKVRFSIIDPVGLGQNFSAFMHLADFDERLVASRIWTESLHINKRLSDLTEHMENVIQKYLRNEFESIQEYNLDAGEVAEPFQILVVANFPANFAEETARRLVSIASSGARCGVYTLISVDGKLRLPRNFDLKDLEANAATLRWDGERFGLLDETLGKLPLTLDSPPADDVFTTIVRTVGERAKDANRVEVPFESIIAQEGQWWTGDSRDEIVVPLGRAGATKLQQMRLGKGTSQHVLISGKTGSGKSTLLHAIITNLASHYGPNEIQYYLIDFKKGVEFKAYATSKMPHARVIAIESEREFGLSVLERLDQELKRRGDLFRKQGVQDVHGYRDANPDAVMPRLLLIIDEFQEFFVKDDKISQDAALLLDRLVRQGRAFGIHVMLGSQTLAGAYSLARSTIGQMAVRIALQCSEGDAHLILSDDNTAARLLSRPGEAIYNDANGLFEGNHPFQIAWLPDHQRDQYLKHMSALADERQVQLPAQIVFEGNVAADPAKNDLLRACLDGSSPPTAATAPRAWLGSAVAIKDPAAAVFRRQSGANLLMVGQQEEMAIGVLANCLVSLAADLVPAAPDESGDDPDAHSPRFIILDGQRAESPASGVWHRVAKQLPLDVTVLAPNKIAETLSSVAAEVDRRLAASDDGASPIFLFIYNLARFRELRKSDEYSFSFEESETTSLDKQLSSILREGPNFGIHTLIWCDTFTNVGRWIDRQSMNDLSLRILFQMSGSDSANLMDTPEASRLGIHRAILYDEEQGEYEKFRPYGPPTAKWLAWVREQLDRRA